MSKKLVRDNCCYTISSEITVSIKRAVTRGFTSADPGITDYMAVGATPITVKVMMPTYSEYGFPFNKKREDKIKHFARVAAQQCVEQMYEQIYQENMKYIENELEMEKNKK